MNPSKKPLSPTGRVTMLHVAQDAGVSVSSVSNYLNGRHNHLREETLQRIRASIETLQYSPSAVARHLKTGHTPMLGLLMPSIANPYHAELALALDTAAQQSGYRTVLGNGHRDAKREREFIEELVSYGIRGIIVTSELRDSSLISDYVKRGITFVLFELRLSDIRISGVDMVSLDNRLATAMAVDHLVALGHRSIAYVTTPVLSANRIARRAGYVQALAAHGLGSPMVVGEHVDQAAFQGDSGLAHFGQHVAAQLLDLPRRPTAAIALNDILAIGVFAGLHKLGWRVPSDCSLVGIDDIQLAGLMVPTLTTLRPDYAGMAKQAIALLQTRLKTPDLPNRESVFAPELMVRESSAPPTHSGDR
jgi:DNA-binding LacI/PurR family transcriptional regulator